MPRPVRIDYPGARHHVMNRGLDRQQIFHDDLDCGEFLDLVDTAAARFGIEIHGFALMPNHFHLMVVSTRGELSEFMAHCQGRFSRYMNRRKGGEGTIWRGRFKSIRVDDDSYWMHLLAYLHLNPVRAGLVDGPRLARWTSRDAYVLGLGKLDTLVTEELLGLFGSPKALEDYTDDVQRKRTLAPDGFDPEDIFRVPSSQNVPPVPAERPPKRATRPPERCIADVLEVTGTSSEDLFVYTRGRPNRAAWLAVWWLTEAGDLSQREIAKRMGLAQPGVAQRMRHMRHHFKDSEIQGWLLALDALARATPDATAP